MTTPYTTGTITLNNGSAVVTGTGTAWATALIAGGIIYAEAANGNAMPILTVDSDTQITAATKWKGASGTYPYALVIDTSYDRQVLANATALAQILQGLQKPSIAALSALTPANNKLPWFNGANTAALADFTPFARALLDDADATTALSTLGVSAFIKGLLDDADGPSALSTLGVSNYAKTLLDDTDASTALSTLGVSAFAKTLLDDTTAGAVWGTLGGAISGGGTGWARMPGGLLVQWGDRTAIVSGGGGGFSVPFPTSFSSASSYSFVGINGEAGSGEVVLNAYNGAGAITASNFYLVLMRNGAIFPDSTAARIRWLAIGS